MPIEAVGQRFISADEIPELAESRAFERIAADFLLDQAMEPLRAGDFDQVRPAADALGTASKYVEACKTYGKDSMIAQTLRDGLDLDCRRLYAEAESKLAAEVFPEIEQQWDFEYQDFFSHGQSLSEITDNGISAVATHEQKLRRSNEKVEESGTYRTIGKLIMGSGIEIKPVKDEVSVITTSQCSDESIELYKRKPDGDFGGEVPEIEKMMIRGVRFDRAHGKRYEMQVALPGIHITNEIVNEAYQIMGVTESGSMLDKTAIHGTQIVTEGDFDILEFVELLDMLASQASGHTIFMGMPVDADRTISPIDYALFAQQSENKQELQAMRARRLREQLIDWEMAGVDHWVAQKMVQDHVTKELHSVARQDPYKAAVIFDAKTAQGYTEVAHLMSLGLYAEADERRVQVELTASTVRFCEGRSCGLEEVELTSQQMKELGIESTLGYKVNKDLERACKGCGKKSILYLHNASEVQKRCTNKMCGAKETKRATKGTS